MWMGGIEKVNKGECPGMKLLISITCSIRYLQLLIQHYREHLIIEADFHIISQNEGPSDSQINSKPA